MGKFIFTQTEIPGVVVIEPQVFGDDRGYFMETYQKDQFAEAGIDKEFVQDNQSRSTRGVLRGLHFQKNHTQGKLVRVTKGEVYDHNIFIGDRNELLDADTPEALAELLRILRQ